MAAYPIGAHWSLSTIGAGAADKYGRGSPARRHRPLTRDIDVHWLLTCASLGHRLEQLREVEHRRLRVELDLDHAVRILPATPKARASTQSMDTGMSLSGHVGGFVDPRGAGGSPPAAQGL